MKKTSPNRRPGGAPRSLAAPPVFGLVIALACTAGSASAEASAQAPSQVSVSAPGEVERSRTSPFLLSAAAGLVSGLEDMARGARADFLAGLAFGPEGRELGAALRLGILWDRGLSSAFIAWAGLAILAGPDLRIEAAAEFPLTSPILPEAVLGRELALEPAGLPCRFAVATTLFELVARRGARPRVTIEGELSWTSYRAQLGGGAGTRVGLVPAALATSPTSMSRAATTKAQAQAFSTAAALAGFDAGFRASLLVRVGG